MQKMRNKQFEKTIFLKSKHGIGFNFDLNICGMFLIFKSLINNYFFILLHFSGVSLKVPSRVQNPPPSILKKTKIDGLVVFVCLYKT